MVYIAYVGQYEGKHIYKYGKSANVYKREVQSHRNAFESFEMLYVHETNFKDQVETLFEKELVLRNMHRTMTINKKKQTELFMLDTQEDIGDVNKVLVNIIQHYHDSHDEKRMATALELEKLAVKKLELQYKLKRLELKMQIMSNNSK